MNTDALLGSALRPKPDWLTEIELADVGVALDRTSLNRPDIPGGSTPCDAGAMPTPSQFSPEVRPPCIGRDAFVRNKRATGRTPDRADPEALGEA
jgi:hypothetical protein